ncbi:hypothetical protein LCGC14_0778910 [marine sediment metagenome]|uniref:Uncharacterized protein n=1 Tax=marine sediment metagenome TaxID=412755 RepID=A0A0F9PWB8_9ZZZZ
MPNPILIEAVAAKVESAYRTDPVPAAATDIIRLAEPFLQSFEIEHLAPNRRESVMSGGLAPVAPGVPQGRVARGRLVAEVRGAGSAYSSSNLPEVDACVRAGGYAATVDETPGTESVTYVRADTGHESMALYIWGEGNLFKVVGVRTAIEWLATNGEHSLFAFDWLGFLDDDPATAAKPQETFVTAVQQSAVGMAFAVGSWSPDHSTGTWRSGAELVAIPSANHSTGWSEIAISRFNPELEFSAQTVPLATYDPYADFKAATARQIDWTIGGSQYNQADLAVVAAYLRGNPGHGDIDGFTAWPVTYLADGSIVFD